MDLHDLQRQWDTFGETDPLWGVLSWPDKAGQRWQIEEFFATGQAEIAEVLAESARLGLEPARGAALDFGCGVGRLSQALAEQFAQVHGVDISPVMLEWARGYNRFGERCIYHLNARADLSTFPTASFDFIYSNITLQHMAPRYSRGYLAEFLRLLKPGGLLIFQLPSHPRARWRRLIQPLKGSALFRLYQRLRYGQQPIMEMYSIPQTQATRLLAAQGGRVAAVQPNTDADAHWFSFRYFVIKNA